MTPQFLGCTTPEQDSRLLSEIAKVTDRLPIEMIPDSRPPRFRWRTKVDMSGPRTMEMEGTLPAGVDVAVVELLSLVAKRQEFKDRVHAYLDQHGVPHHPAGAAGCRIGDRMDWLMTKIKQQEADIADLKKKIEESAERIAQQSEILSRRAEKGIEDDNEDETSVTDDKATPKPVAIEQPRPPQRRWKYGDK